MGLTSPLPISYQRVGETSELRVDPHYFSLIRNVRNISSLLENVFPLRKPFLQEIGNGANLPQASYEQQEDGSESEYFYASVGAISQFSLRYDRCEQLKDPSIFQYGIDLAALGVNPNEVLITRSGTPGIAWPASYPRDEEHIDATIIPSGFLIRVVCDADYLLPGYLAAVLNHPVWRVWSSSLATGKRQRNLSQEHLEAISIPKLKLHMQEQIDGTYNDALKSIDQLLSENEKLFGVCDNILRAITSLKYPSLVLLTLSLDKVSLSNCSNNANIRIDGRYHRGEVHEVVRALDNTDCISLSSLLSAEIIKSKQPNILVGAADGAAAFVIATSSIQAGQVIFENLKPTTEEDVDQAGERRIQAGDILVTMDGEGSIGKAAIFSDDYPAVTDSHIGILRLTDPDLSYPLACFLNSSLGQAQFYLYTSGATGQTQVSPTDLGNFKVPIELLVRAAEVSSTYQRELHKYESITKRVRRQTCEQAALTTAVILDSGSFSGTAASFLEENSDPLALIRILDLLKPSMF